MSLWKKLFGISSNKEGTHPSISTTLSPLDQHKLALQQKGLSTPEDLEILVRPLLQEATRLVVQPPSIPDADTQMLSHFGGQPYFEKGESWPMSDDGSPMDFIFQIVNRPEILLPDAIAMVQFYYDWEEFPWDTEEKGWKVKTYTTLSSDLKVKIDKPTSLENSTFCQIDFIPFHSLPDWDGIELVCPDASHLSYVLNEDQPWQNYQDIAQKITGESEFQSQLGGYPKWIQGDSTPLNSKNETLPLLFQIDSEEHPDIMWGDSGMIYVFYDEASSQFSFVLQCY